MTSESDLEMLVAIPATPRNERDVRPQCKCFCCCDSGLVDNPYLSQLVIGKNGRPFICQRLDCTAGEKFRNAYFLTDVQRQEYAKKYGGEAMSSREYQAQWDMRLTAAHCEQMHLWHKQYWEKWAQERSRQLNYGKDFDESRSRTAISDLTQKLSMPNGKES
jgi:hypothetical protein